MSQSYELAAAYINALNAGVCDFRAIHDTRKDVPAIPIRGTIDECWKSLCHYNDQGYGIFVTVAAMDGNGHHLANVQSIRAHYIDLDNLSAQQNYERAAAWSPAPSFAVTTSPGKMHVYWVVAPYTGNDRFQLLQRKLRQQFDGDRSVIDAARVMRLPGTLHLKVPTEPHMVTCHALSGFGVPLAVEQLEAALAAVNVIDGGMGERRDLGEPSLAAPSLDWIKYGLSLVDPNQLERGEWIAITCAVKQAGWSLGDIDRLFIIWGEWCARYEHNDLGENLKQWNSIRNTELGWQSLLTRIPSLKAAVAFGGVSREAEAAETPPLPEPPTLDCSGEYLTHIEQQQWFKGCTFVLTQSAILTPDGRFLKSSDFNAYYGGKWFIVDGNGKKVNEAWQAATRSTLWNVPRVDHVRFVPSQPHGEILLDMLGRKGINAYKPLVIKREPGDASPFLRHIAALLPEPSDQKILIDYLAHNVQYPGHKIPWAPVIQSAEGAGKGVIKKVMQHCMGLPYCYFPNAKELTDSGSQFNAWMRNKLFILADEIKVDDRMDLIEVLKPMISEEIIEIQSKGVDQSLEDNFSNWMFFTNWKNAIPVTANGRRFAIFYSALQTKQDVMERQMGDSYFNAMYAWLAAQGGPIVADYLMNYPIARGAIPMRAPDTSSSAEAIKLSRSPIERILIEAVEDGLPGFRGGWISSVAALARVKTVGATQRAVSVQTVGTVIEQMGYYCCGRAPRAFFQEGDANTRPTLYHFGGCGDMTTYGALQGWE